MFFSIIVPIYNAEKNLQKCLDSICAQTFSDFEVLMIDDGSEDNSAAICEKYVQNDDRFRLVRQENKGVSVARNEGLRRAEGVYICFIDSDDYVSERYLEILYSRLSTDDTDVLFFGYYAVDQVDHVTGVFIPPTDLSGADLLMELSNMDLFGYAWIKCFSKKAIGNHLFSEDMSLFEDEVFACAVLKYTDRFHVLAQPLYYYVTDGLDMLTRRTYKDYCNLSDRVFVAWSNMIEEIPEKDFYLERKANAFVARCRYYGLEHDINYRSFFESLANTSFFQQHTDWTKLDRQIQRKNWFSIKAAILLYRLKTRISEIFK